VPGIAGWYTADEAPAGVAPIVFKQFKTLRHGNPDGVTFIAQADGRELIRWRDTADVLGVDPYPIYSIPEGETSPLEMVTDLVDQAQRAVEHSRPVWAVIQYFQFGARGHWPTYEELRTMSYMGIVGGAKGLLYWSYGAKGLSWVKDPTRKAELWQRLVRVTTEIKTLEPALLAPDAPDVVSLTAGGPSLRLLAKRDGSTRYVIAVNQSSKTVHGTFRLAETGSVEVLGENRRPSIEPDNAFVDDFGPHATHVYRIRGAAQKS
jgi:hypothetical protein